MVYVEDIGINQDGEFTDLDDNPICWMFKLYPWKFMFREDTAYITKDTSMFISHIILD